MKRMLVIAPVVVLLMLCSAAFAGDFDFLKDLNAKAQSDMNAFAGSLSATFNLPVPKVNTVIQAVAQPADAYMVLKVGQLANQPTDKVLAEYTVSKGKGWGVIAKNMGIKPGSKEFHELKKGYDYDAGGSGGKGHGKGKGHKK